MREKGINPFEGKIIKEVPYRKGIKETEEILSWEIKLLEIERQKANYKNRNLGDCV